MKSQERITVKLTFAGERAPEYEHFSPFQEGEAKRFYRKAIEDRTLEIRKVEIYRELMLYTQTLWERWELEPSGDGDGDDV